MKFRYCEIWLRIAYCTTLCVSFVFNEIIGVISNTAGSRQKSVICRHQVSKQSKFRFFFSMCYSCESKCMCVEHEIEIFDI